MAAVPANGGVWRQPVLFESQVQSSAAADARVVSEEHAVLLTDMMEETVTAGTARRTFRERGFRVPGAVGKTGCLADRNPFRDYSWFVGFAPRDNPRVAVAAVIVNDPKWRIRATYLGREALRLYLEGKPGRVAVQNPP
jgi:penicillin-binding protein A